MKKGKYNVTVNYGGNENYTGNNTTQKLTIKEKVAEAKTTSSSTNGQSETYDPYEGMYSTYDSDGKIQWHMTPEREAQERENFNKYEPANGRG